MLKPTLFNLALIATLCLTTEAAQKCLMPKFDANGSTSDGLMNCTCPAGLEYDEMFGVCFKNQCKEHCNQMNCAIRKPIQNERRFDYYCYCPQGWITLNSNYNIKCVPFESAPGHQFVSKNLPKNPLLLKKLNCSQSYELVDNEYKCKCFDSYKLNEQTGDCVPQKKCMRQCGPNAVCTVDDQNNTHCTCKTGFTGPDCEEHFCEMKNVTKNEKKYLDQSIQNVCGTTKCNLKANHEFECACPFGMERSGDGFCRVQKPCLPNEIGHKTCESQTALCSVRTDESKLYSCRCEGSLGYNLERKCNNYTSKHTRPEQVTHNLRMKVRLDWEAEELFNSLFFNQMLNLISIDLDRKLPGYALNEFIDYQQKVFRSYEKIAFYQPILEEKFRDILMRGLKGLIDVANCGQNYKIYPKINYDRNSFELTRLVQTVFDVDYEIYCPNGSMNVNSLYDRLHNEFLINDKVENYYYLKRVGFVLPESISLV